jgi:hypothetical protein
MCSFDNPSQYEIASKNSSTTEVNNLHTPYKLGLFVQLNGVDLMKSEHKY